MAVQKTTPLRPGTGMVRRARALRRASTLPERKLWNILRAKWLGGFKFRHQAAIGEYIVDYYCPDQMLVVELDGISHVGRAREDARRTAYLESQGLRVLCVTNDDVIHEAQAVADYILRALNPLSPPPTPP